MKADYIMVGGFLGAGKTTALLRLAQDRESAGKGLAIEVTLIQPNDTSAA